MSTASAIITGKLEWTQVNDFGGGFVANVDGSYSKKKQLTSGSSANQVNWVYATQTTLAGGASVTLDLYGTLTDLFGATISAAKLKAIYIELTDDTTASAIAIGNATNPVAGILSAAGTISVLNGGFITLCGGPTGYTVTASTGDGLKILNSDGSNTATIKIALIGS